MVNVKKYLHDKYDRVDTWIFNHTGVGLITGFLTMSVGGAVLVVGTFVVSEINASINASSSAVNDVVTKVYSGMKMGGVAILGVGAALTIGALMNVGGR
jgi:hypothetical protein